MKDFRQKIRDCQIVEDLMFPADFLGEGHLNVKQQTSHVGGIACSHRYPGKPCGEGAFKSVLKEDHKIENLLDKPFAHPVWSSPGAARIIVKRDDVVGNLGHFPERGQTCRCPQRDMCRWKQSPDFFNGRQAHHCVAKPVCSTDKNARGFSRWGQTETHCSYGLIRRRQSMLILGAYHVSGSRHILIKGNCLIYQHDWDIVLDLVF